MVIASAERSKVRYHYLAQGDLDAISAALVEKWPRMRFLPWSYSRTYEPEEGRPPLPDEIVVPYFDKLQYFREHTFLISWVEPEGWEPRWRWRWAWGDPTKGGFYRIANEPPFRVMWQLSETFPRNLPDGHPGIALGQGRVEGYFLSFEKERESFLRKVWRVFERFATNRVPVMNWLSFDRRYSRIFPAGSDWIGYEALRWLRADSRHSLGGEMFLAPPPIEPKDGVPASYAECGTVGDRRKWCWVQRLPKLTRTVT